MLALIVCLMAGSAPVITQGPVNMTVVAGDSVRFECIAAGAPRPSVTWLRGKVLNVCCSLIIVCPEVCLLCFLPRDAL